MLHWAQVSQTPNGISIGLPFFCVHRNKKNTFPLGGQPRKLPLPLGDLDPIKYMVSWALRHLDQLPNVVKGA